MMVSISASAIAPVAYFILVIGSLITFSTIYRRRKALQSLKQEPWFPNHRERDIYLTLLHLDSPPCPPKLLKAALLERAREDVSRVLILRESKTAGSQLLQKGSLSESTFQQINAAEAEMNLEIQDVIAEARALGGDEWAASILAQASEYHQKCLILKTIERSKAYAEDERKKWNEELSLRKEYQDKQREIALKELAGEEGQVKTSGITNGEVEGEIPNGTGEGSAERKSKKKKNKK
jgi:translocation protein SEC66